MKYKYNWQQETHLIWISSGRILCDTTQAIDFIGNTEATWWDMIIKWRQLLISTPTSFTKDIGFKICLDIHNVTSDTETFGWENDRLELRDVSSSQSRATCILVFMKLCLQCHRRFPSQRPMARNIDVLINLRLNKRLNKHSKRRWFETHSLWRHFNGALGTSCQMCHQIYLYIGICFNIFLPWCNKHFRIYTALIMFMSRWRHQMETFASLLAICAGNMPVPGEFSTQRPVTRSFDVFFDLRLNKRLSKREAADLKRYRAHYDVTVM